LRLHVFSVSDQIDNTVENLDSQEKAFAALNQKKAQMKEQHRLLQDTLTQLEDRVRIQGNKDGEFQDSRVYHLWALAKKAAMTEQELESIKVILGRRQGGT